MAFCVKCGKTYDEGAKFCPSCGAAVSETLEAAAQADLQANPNDATENKTMAIIAYILFFIPLLTGDYKKSYFVKYHTNQGTVLFLANLAAMVVSSILTVVVIGAIFSLATFVLCIIGILNAVNGRMEPLPVIGKFTIIKLEEEVKPFGNDMTFGDEITKAEENFKKGNEYFENKKFSEARYQYDKVILDFNKDLEMLALLNRGLAYYKLGDHGDAYGDWNYVLRYDKNPERINAAKKLFEKLPEMYRP